MLTLPNTDFQYCIPSDRELDVMISGGINGFSMIKN